LDRFVLGERPATSPKRVGEDWAHTALYIYEQLVDPFALNSTQKHQCTYISTRFEAHQLYACRSFRQNWSSRGTTWHFSCPICLGLTAWPKSFSQIKILRFPCMGDVLRKGYTLLLEMTPWWAEGGYVWTVECHTCTGGGIYLLV